MESLPDEIIEYILKHPDLKITDVISFSSTSSRYREIVITSESLWKVKFLQRWPRSDDIQCYDWQNEYKSRHRFEKHVLSLLTAMSTNFFEVDVKNIGDLQLNYIMGKIKSHEYSFEYLRELLIDINTWPQNESHTIKYYANMLLKHIHKKHCRRVWKNLMRLRPEDQTLEKGALFVSLWCDEHEKGVWNMVVSELDSLADLVRKHVLQESKNHPLKKVSEDTFEKWRKHNITGNMFEPQDCKAIIWGINHVLFEDLKFCVAYDSTDSDRKKSDIRHALQDRKANPIVFSVIFESLARRLGVKLEILEFLDHCLLRWKEDYGMEGTPAHYISASTDGIFMKSRCPKKYESSLIIAPCNLHQVAQRAALHLFPREHRENYQAVRDAAELMLTIKPYSLECYQHLSRSFMLHEMDATFTALARPPTANQEA